VKTKILFQQLTYTNKKC